MTDSVYREAVASFQSWLEEAESADIVEPTAMTLATRGPNAGVSARTVLLKQADEAGLVFYTNTRSRKGRQLDLDPRCALCFLWAPIKRQVLVEGRAGLVPDGEADAYWTRRPRVSQLGAWASHQSEPLDDRAELEARYREYEKRFEGGPVPRPNYWTGYRVVPYLIEFWSGRDARLHDRWRYARGEKGWFRQRLNP